MAKVEPFELYTERYENWFIKNRFAFESELRAVMEVIPESGTGIEIGVGSGQFAKPLGIQFGVDPSREMLFLARKRGIKTVRGVAEALPLKSLKFDYVIMVTTICFVDDLEMTFKEAYRIISGL